MLKMAGIHKTYRTGSIETHALENFDLEVEDGEFVAIMGPSGCGKTTFLNVAGLLDTFNQGQYFLDQVDVSSLSDSRMSRIRNEKIGFVFQSFNLIPDLNVYDNVDVPLRYRSLNRTDRKAAIEASLRTVGLTARMKHFPSQLSGGQQQRVAIARALVGQPGLVLADEPTGNLDSQMAHEILDLLEQINGEKGTTIIMVTHDPLLAARASRIVYLLDGRVVETPSVAVSPVQPESSVVTINQ